MGSSCPAPGPGVTEAERMLAGCVGQGDVVVRGTGSGWLAGLGKA